MERLKGIRKEHLRKNRNLVQDMDKRSRLSKTGYMITAAMICCFLWGSAFPCIKTGYRLLGIGSSDYASRILFAGVRFALAGIMVIAFASLLEGHFKRPSDFKRIAVLSIFQTVVQYCFFYTGLVYTTGVKSSVINGAGTFLTLFVCCLIFHQEKLSFIKVAGSLLGFAGIILINLSDGLNLDMSLKGEGFVLISSLSGAFASGFIKHFSKKSDVVMLSGYQFFVGGLAMSVFGTAMGGTLHISSAAAVLLILYMGFISAAAYTLWGLLLKYNDVSKVSACKFMNPVFGVILSYIILGERGQMGIRLAAALALVCMGIYLVNRKVTVHNSIRKNENSQSE